MKSNANLTAKSWRNFKINPFFTCGENEKEKKKMKRNIAVIVSVLALALGAQSAFAQEDAASAAGVQISGGATIVLQGASKVHDGSDKGSIEASYSYDLELSKEFDNDSSIFVHIEGSAGEGLNSKLNLFNVLNGDAGSSNNALEITELWYEKGLFDKKLTLTFGKLDAAGYFDANEAANSETDQFLAGMFVNNAAVALPDPNLGLRATYAPIESVELTYAYFNQNEEWNNIDTNGFNIIEAVYKLSDKGNYRLAYWANAAGATDIKDGERTLDYGIGLSVDQSVSENIILFARFGYRNQQANTVEIEYEDDGVTPAKITISPQTSWSFGAQFKGALWSRENDAVGIAVGQNM
ncbi:MAG: carbohydrate porin, partial [Endomicrobium sp.]|nr:carbohydrate porin [Endomicrobium sp.]